MDLDGAVALVTGGSSGIGAATTAQLRDAGARVAVLDVQAQEGDGDLAVKCDVGDEAEVHDGHSGRGTFTARPINAYASTVNGHGHTMDMANHRLRSLLATGRQTQARRDLYIK